MPRDWNECPHRNCAGSPSESMAACRLLSSISTVRSSELCQVSSDECAACCESFLPTDVDWNPVIASLLCRIAERVIEARGTDELTTQDATRLRESAFMALPLVLPDEDDCVDTRVVSASDRVVTLEDVVRHLPLPVPINISMPKPMSWAVGLSTTFRRQSTLEITAQSLMAAGWDSFHLFVDGPVDIPSSLGGCRQSRRNEQSGAWPAWCWALETLLRDYPQAEVLMLVQDDTLFPAIGSIREYVEQVLGCECSPQFLTLYTSSEDVRSSNDWQPYSGVWRYGALAIVLTRNTAKQLWQDIQQGSLEMPGDAGIDLRLGLWAEKSSTPLWYPSPSLVQHIGQVSSLWNRARAVGMRRASRWLMDEISVQAPP